MRILQIMEEVENNNKITQRELAKKLNISIGMTNLFIKRIIKKGYFKITNIPKNRLMYMITPKGIIEKSRLTFEYLRYSLNFYKSLKAHVLEKFSNLEDKGVKRVAFYGLGEVSELSYLFLQETNLELVAVAEDFDIKDFFGFDVILPDSLNEARFDIIIITTFDNLQQRIERLVKAGIDSKKIQTL